LGSNEIPRRIIESKLEGSTRMRRPELRWLDGVVEDLRKLAIRRRWMLASRGRGFYRKPKVIVGCSATDYDGFKVIGCW